MAWQYLAKRQGCNESNKLSTVLWFHVDLMNDMLTSRWWNVITWYIYVLEVDQQEGKYEGVP